MKAMPVIAGRVGCCASRSALDRTATIERTADLMRGHYNAAACPVALSLILGGAGMWASELGATGFHRRLELHVLNARLVRIEEVELNLAVLTGLDGDALFVFAAVGLQIVQHGLHVFDAE